MAGRRTLALKVETEISGLDKLGNLGKKLQNVGRAATTFVTLPLLGAGAAAINFASDLEEATNKATTVFGDASADLLRSSESLTDAFSQAEFLDLAGTFGALLKNMEFTTEEAGRMSEGFLDLAADMASFHNADPTEAIQAIRSALAGEFEPLKRFGVALNVATIEAKALEMGLWDGTGAIDANTRALVVQSELIRQQPDLIGDWDRTLGGAANQQRLLTKNFQDAAAAIGQELLPIATELITTLNGWVKAFKELSPETRKMIVQFAGIAAAAGPVLFIFGSLLRVLSPFAKLIGPVAGKLTTLATKLGISRLALLGWTTAIVAAGVAVGQQYDEVLEGLTGQILTDFAKAHGIAADQVTRDVNRISEALGVTIPEAQERLLAGMNGVAEDYDITVRGLVDSTNAATGEISESLLGAGAAWEDYQNQITAGSDEIDSAAADMAGAIPEAMEDALEAGEEIARRTPGALANELRAGIEDYDEALQELTDVAVNSVSDLAERQKIEGILASQELTDALNSDSTRTRLLAADLVTDLVSDYELLAPGAMDAGELVNPALAAGIRSNLGLTTTAARSVRDAAGQPLVDLGEAAFGWGATLSANFHAGMSSYIRPIREASIRLGDAAASGLRLRSPAEEGPLSEPADVWGKMLGMNFAKGLRDSIGAVKGASLAVAGAAVLSGSITDGLGALPSLSPAVGGAGVVNNFYLRWDGEPPKGRNEEEIISNLQRLSPLVGLVGGS